MEIQLNKINNYNRYAVCKNKAYGTWHSQAITHISTTISVKNKDYYYFNFKRRTLDWSLGHWDPKKLFSTQKIEK